MNDALTSGILSAMPKPASTSCALTVLISDARFTLTAPLSISTAPPVSPVRAATSSVCAVRFASTQACLERVRLHEGLDAVADEAPDPGRQRARRGRSGSRRPLGGRP